MDDGSVLALFTDALAPLGAWLLALAGVGIGLWMVSKAVVWFWWLVADLMESDSSRDADARAHGYRDSSDRARDHW